jgi:ATP-dependent metalloprotease FtsH
MKKSVLLQYILANAEMLMAKCGDQKMTANHFMAALCDILSQQHLPEELNNSDTIKELGKLCEMFMDSRLDAAMARDMLIASIKDEEYDSSQDEETFAKICYSVDFTSQLLGRSEIDSIQYVKNIFIDPSEALKSALQKSLYNSTPIEATESGDIFSKKPEQKSEDTPLAKDADAAEKLGRTLEREIPERKRDAEKGESESLVDIVGKTRAIQDMLLENIFGQDQAVDLFVSGYFQYELAARSMKEVKKPQALFLFAGPPGVGKTYLAEKAAEALKLPFKRFDMSEYSDDESVVEFCGSDKVYKNGKEGNVTGFVEKHPRCVLLFDEIEKAHLSIIHLFLQMLDAGHLRDNFTDTVVPFNQAVIIFTTNAGKNLYDDPDIPNLSSVPRKKIVNALATDINPLTNAPLFPAAICSRFASGNIVMFNHLGAHDLHRIALNELEKNAGGFEAAMGVNVEFDEKVASAIMFSEGGKADARTVKGRSAAFFHEELYELLRLISAKDESSLDLKKIKVDVCLDGARDDIKKLFVDPNKPNVLLFSDNADVAEGAGKIDDISFHVVSSIDAASEVLFNYDISLILCDVHCGEKKQIVEVLSAEDINSAGIEFIEYVTQRYDTPVYILDTADNEINQDELLAFIKRGAHGKITFGTDGYPFDAQVSEKCNVAYQQANMMRLGTSNKIVTYNTAQSLTDNGHTAKISLFGFDMVLATDVDDSKNILDSVSRPNVHFDEVIGAEDAKEELKYFVEYLKNPVKFMRKGLRAPKGVLLYGPPGTGKTLMAKAMATESDVTFITAEGNQFLKKYVGEGSEAVHALFAQARKYAPSIIFIDEIDAIAKSRNTDSPNSSSGDILTSFLTEMDGFNTNTSKPVFVLAATNYDVDQNSARTLDPAILRRFDRRIYVDLPNKEERKKYLKQKISGSPLFDLSEEQLDNIALRSTGMSLAELESIFEMALRNAVKCEGGVVNDASFEEAFETFNSGEKREWSLNSLERTARHEAGHALMCWLGGERPSYLTVVARGSHGGYMQYANDESKGTYTRAELLARITTALGGRAAEMVYYGEDGGLSTGASGDIHSATSVAEQMICNYGMDKEIGISYVDRNNVPSEYFTKIRNRVNAILGEQLEVAIKAISDNRAVIDELVSELLEKNHLKEKDLARILEKAK